VGMITRDLIHYLCPPLCAVKRQMGEGGHDNERYLGKGRGVENTTPELQVFQPMFGGTKETDRKRILRADARLDSAALVVYHRVVVWWEPFARLPCSPIRGRLEGAIVWQETE
jgi:hypothetical protein